MTNDELNTLTPEDFARLDEEIADKRWRDAEFSYENFVVRLLRNAVRERDEQIARLKKANESAFQRGFNAGAAQLSRALKEVGKL
jgi:hypothetical protein